jgi:hypothetical protein
MLVKSDVTEFVPSCQSNDQQKKGVSALHTTRPGYLDFVPDPLMYLFFLHKSMSTIINHRRTNDLKHLTLTV